MRRIRTALAVALTASLVFAACTGDDDDDDTTAEDTETTDETAADDESEDAGATDEESDDGGDTSASGDTLAAVQDAGEVRCGTRDALAGFAVLTEDGDHVGFDADFCRVIAAAVLGDAEAVNFVDLETDDRFTALQSGEIDVLVRNTTWTATRDGAEGATFLQPNFYDGQGMMVASDSGFSSLEDLSGATICVAQGTTTESNVAIEFERLGLDAPNVQAFEDVDAVQAAFEGGQCDGWSSDRSQLVALRSDYPAGEDALTILEGTFSKEPLAPAVADGDTQWAQVVNWAVLATIAAEEFGVDSTNVDDMLTSDDPSIVTFLGGDDLDTGLGLPTDFAYQVISQVGNYAEIYEEHIGPLGLERGLNSLWTEGGLLYAPPYR